jgi:predicted dehydrogenase
MDPAYGYAGKLASQLTVDGKKTKQSFGKRDQFAAELIYFANCIREGREPEPSGWEGLADVRIIEALYRSCQEGRAISIEPIQKEDRPTRAQQIDKPPVADPKLVKVESPST